MLRIKKKHPLAIRWFHWLNVPLLATMIWSGLLIYWANAVYGFPVPVVGRVQLPPEKVFAHNGQGGIDLFAPAAPKWLPNNVNFGPAQFKGWEGDPTEEGGPPTLYNLSFRLAEGMAWHFFFMWFFTINGLLYVIYTAVSGEWRLLVPRKGSLNNAWRTVLHDLHLVKQAPAQEKYNGAQQITYTAIIVMGIGSVLTGIAIHRPTQAGWLIALFGGYGAARFIHFWLMIGYVLFFLVHIIQVVRAGWNNFRGMITGRELVREADA